MKDLEVYYTQIKREGLNIDYILAIDEHGSPSYPRSNKAVTADFYFFLTGVLVKPPGHFNRLVIEINSFKQTWFGNSSIILHGTEMTSRKGKFRILKDMETRKLFYQHLFGIISKLDVEVYIAGIDKKHIYSKYKHPIDLYHASIQILAERIVKHINPSRIVIWFENRGRKEDLRLKDAIKSLRENGFADPNLPKYIPNKLKAIHWLYWGSPKTENIAVLQTADLIAHFYGRYLRMTRFEERSKENIRTKTPEIIWFSELMDEFESSGKLKQAFMPSNIKYRLP